MSSSLLSGVGSGRPALLHSFQFKVKWCVLCETSFCSLLFSRWALIYFAARWISPAPGRVACFESSHCLPPLQRGGEWSDVLYCPAFSGTDDFLFSNNDRQSRLFHHSKCEWGNCPLMMSHRVGYLLQAGCIVSPSQVWHICICSTARTLDKIIHCAIKQRSLENESHYE